MLLKSVLFFSFSFLKECENGICCRKLELWIPCILNLLQKIWSTCRRAKTVKLHSYFMGVNYSKDFYLQQQHPG